MTIKASGFHDNKEQSNSVFLFLKRGTTHVRILPAYNEKGQFFKEVKEVPWTNEDGKYSPIVSPATNNQPCPFVEEGTRLYKAGGEENVEKSQAFRPRSQFLFNVVVKSTPDGEVPVEQCVKVLKCGTSVKRQLLDLDSDVAGGWGDITNLEKGIDVRITREGTSRNDTTYTVKGLPGGRTNILEWLEEKGFSQELRPHDLDEFYTPRSYEELVPLVEMKKAQFNLADPFEDVKSEDTEEEMPIPQVVSENTTEAPGLPE